MNGRFDQGDKNRFDCFELHCPWISQRTSTSPVFFFVLTVHSHAFMVAPSRYKKGAGFPVAWLVILEWLFVVCSTTIFPAQLTAEMASIWHPEYTVQRWHIYLVYVAFPIGGTAIVILCHSYMAKIESVFCTSFLLNFGTFVLTLLVASRTKQDTVEVFTAWKNTSGWPDGLSVVLDVGQGMWM